MKVEKGLTMFFTAEDEFSNWYLRDFTMKGITFNCGEMAMMFSKSMLFGDKDTAAKILKEKNPKYQKALGKQVRGFVQSIWDERSSPIVRTISLHRISQHEDMKKLLLSTMGTTIVEASKYDRIWGVGFSENDPRIHNRELWGLNKLGYAHMENREYLFKLEQRKKLEREGRSGPGF